MSVKKLFYQIVLQFNRYCLFRIVWSKDNTIQPILSFQNILSTFFLWPLSTSIFDILKNRYLRYHFFKENLILFTKHLIRFNRSCFFNVFNHFSPEDAHIIFYEIFWSFLWKMDLIWVFSFKQSLIIERQHDLICLQLKAHLIFF